MEENGNCSRCDKLEHKLKKDWKSLKTVKEHREIALETLAQIKAEVGTSTLAWKLANDALVKMKAP